MRRRYKAGLDAEAPDDAQTLAEETVLSRDAKWTRQSLVHEDGRRGMLHGLANRRRERFVQTEPVRPFAPFGYRGLRSLRDISLRYFRYGRGDSPAYLTRSASPAVAGCPPCPTRRCSTNCICQART